MSINTPIGLGSIVGLSPDRTQILIMHTYKEKRGTYARWWNWDDEKGEIVNGQKTEEGVENNSEDAEKDG